MEHTQSVQEEKFFSPQQHRAELEKAFGRTSASFAPLFIQDIPTHQHHPYIDRYTHNYIYPFSSILHNTAKSYAAAAAAPSWLVSWAASLFLAKAIHPAFSFLVLGMVAALTAWQYIHTTL